MFRRVVELTLFVTVAVATAAGPGIKEFKPGWNLFSKQQDVQLGREAASQVEQQMQVVRDAQLQAYVERIGRKLAASPRASDFPYTFKVVNDQSINAFALPGGPTFVHTGLIKAAENEAQLAGVLAHEISHVALRHGTNQASKANLIQLPAMLAGALTGGSLLGQLAQVGIGLGAQSVLLKYSRDAEKQADLNGALIMADAGYNPLEMARFFEKLAAQSGSRGSAFFSDHPDPGDRMRYVEEQVRALPQRNYSDNGSGELPSMQSRVNGLPAAPQRSRAVAGQTGGGGDPRHSGQFREFRNNSVSIQYPANWEPFGDQNGGAVTIAPRSGLVQDRSGNVAVGYGVMVSIYSAHQGDRPDLRQDTADLVGNLRQSNPALQVAGGQRSARVNNQPAIVTTLSNQSPLGGRETDMLVTVSRPEGLLYMIFIAPQQDYQQIQPVFEQMLRTVRF